MRIALVHNVLRGGGLRRMQEQVSRLDAEVIEFALEGAAPVTASPRVTAHRRWAPLVPRLARPALRYSDVLQMRRAWRRLAAQVDEAAPDVVLCNSCHVLQAPLALLFVRGPKVYFCDEPRRVDYEPAARDRRNPYTRPVYGPLYAWERRLDRRAVAAADVLLANSAYGAAQVESAYGRVATAVPMGVSEFFRPGAQVERRHVLSVGTLIPDKGHDLAIEACALAGCSRPVIIVAPRAAPDEADRLARLAASRRIPLAVRVGITDEELREAYRRAFATVYLSRAEPFGLASVEAQACGSPVIVADEGGLPETLGQGGGGWAVPRTAAAAAERLRALESPDVWSRASEQATRQGRERTWERSAERLQALLEEACRGGHPS